MGIINLIAIKTIGFVFKISSGMDYRARMKCGDENLTFYIIFQIKALKISDVLNIDMYIKIIL